MGTRRRLQINTLLLHLTRTRCNNNVNQNFNRPFAHLHVHCLWHTINLLINNLNRFLNVNTHVNRNFINLLTNNRRHIRNVSHQTKRTKLRISTNSFGTSTLPYYNRIHRTLVSTLRRVATRTFTTFNNFIINTSRLESNSRGHIRVTHNDRHRNATHS